MPKPVFERSASADRLYPSLVRSVAAALYHVFIENRYADKVIEYTLRNNPKAGSKDRAFIAESVYEIVRYYRLYTTILNKTPQTEAEFWSLCGAHFFYKNIELPPWAEFEGLKTILEKALPPDQWPRAVRESVPDWIDDVCSAELGDQWDRTLQYLNQPASVVLRANRLKNDRGSLQKTLQEEGVETQLLGDADALLLPRRQNLFKTTAFKKGFFEVQDFSSQYVAPLLAPEPGMRVVDACAGGGGKTLHLSALMQNRGSLIALDTLAWKLDELRLRARRAGATNIETRPIENRKTIKRLYGSADRLLLDVPCSGLGVLRRNPDTKWKLTQTMTDELRNVQQDILQSYSPILKPGGRMVYATCSILPSENNRQVETFLNSAAGKGFKLLSDRAILPQDEGFDGFYMALLEKEGA